MKKSFNKLLLLLCIAFLGAMFGLGGLYSEKTVQAQSITPPDGYTVHNINGGGLTIESSGKYYVYGTGEETANETVVKGNIQVEMILDNVNVKGADYRSYGAISVTGGATLTIRLVGSNTLIGCSSAPGIEVPEGNTLIITSYDGDGKTTGYLSARTGSATFIKYSGPFGRGGAGIGAGGSYGSSTSPETLGNIIIKGGTIEAKGLHGGAGIGGAYNGSTGSIRIEGGIVRARTQEWDDGLGGGAAIGGGFCGYVPKIEITGGTVLASVAGSGDNTMTGADIGAGYFSKTSDSDVKFGDIIISGGNVTCSGVSIGNNDSIGFGRVYNTGFTYTYSGSVTVTGGTIVANKRIANLNKVTGGSIKGTTSGEPTNGMNAVSLKTITVSGAFNNQELTRLILSDNSTYNINDVVILDTNKLYLYLPNNVKVTSATVGGVVYTNYTNGDTVCFHDARSTYKPAQNGSDTHHDIVYACCGFYSSTEEHSFDNTNANCITPEICACGATKDLYPDIHATTKTHKVLNQTDKTKHNVMHSCCNAVIETELHNFNGLVCSDCSHICEHPQMDNAVCVYCGFEGVAYIDRTWDGTKVVEEVKATLFKPAIPDKNTETLTDGWYYLADSYSRMDPLIISGTVHLIIGNGVTVEVRKGIRVEEGNTLYIYAQSNDPSVMGTLIARGYDQSAGIGSASNVNAGTIVINGGKIQANSGSSAGYNGRPVCGAAIGGGDSGNGGTVTINGGIVSAESARAAAIGNGVLGKSAKITINGGTVTLIDCYDTYALGGSWTDNTNVITINGGTIISSLDERISGIMNGSIVITGGAFSAIGNVKGSVKDANGNALTAYEITLEGLTENVRIEELEGVNYRLFEVQSTLDKLWVFLPEGKVPSSIKLANGVEYVCNDNGTFHVEHGEKIPANCIQEEKCSLCFTTFGEPNGHHFENGLCSVCNCDENNIYHISTVEHYIAFVKLVQTGESNLNAVLDNDLDISEICKAMGNFILGSLEVKYGGVFDGNGHTLTVYAKGADNIAPFGIIEGATIKNLIVEGSVIASGKFAGGLVSEAFGTNLIQNVLVKTVIQSSVSGDGTHGGIVGYNEGSITLNNVGFMGKINGKDTTSVGGFIGWVANDSILTINDSFNLGSFNVANNSNHLIARNYDHSSVTVNLNNYYYLNVFGDGSIINGIQKVEYAQVVSGEFIYLLNKKVTDGTQIWYQVVGSEQITFSTNTVYKVTCGDYEFYSNTNESHENHEFVGGYCVNCNTPAMPKLIEGVYQITNLGELLWFAGLVNGSLEGVEQNKNANAILLTDIDLEGARWQTIASTMLYVEATYNSGKYPDAGYGGTFDGNFHTIKNFVVYAEGGIKGSYGLFGSLSGTVKNLAVENMTFDLNGAIDVRAGAIVGQIIGGTVESCYVKNATIAPENYVVGGIAGCNCAGVIKNCFVYDSLVLGGASRYGYIVGDNRAGISATDRQGQVINCYTDGNPCVGSYAGIVENSFIARNGELESGEVAFNLGSAFGQEIGVDSLPVFNGAKVYKITCVNHEYYANEEKESSDAHVFGEDFACEICGGYLEPQKQDANSYLISNASELFWYAEQVNLGKLTVSNAYLTQDIDLKGVEWTPIGNDVNAFGSTRRRNFYGQGYTIKGLFISKTHEYVGLFGNVTDGYVKDLTVEGEILVKSNKAKYVGVFAYLSKATVNNVISKVNITFDSDIKWDGYVGGLAGAVNPTTATNLEKVHYFGTIDHKNNNGTVGGIVGTTTYATSNGSSVRDMVMAGTIKSNAVGNVVIGGLIGSTNGASIQYGIFAGSIELGENVNDANVAAIATFINYWRTDALYYVGEYKARGDSSVKNPTLTSTTLKEIYSGKIAYDINVDMWGDRASNYYWKQDLSKQSLPDFVSGTIYQVTNCNGEGVTYSNTNEPAEHKDYVGDGDHLCEGCGITVSECLDTEKDGDHVCDDCGEVLSECLDAEKDGDHACDECGEVLSECLDAEKDGDHVCDECGEV
ncbi:MAG: hypothetical protein IJW13_02560, partial [Clostridia bacterium]|nr:hypothetical protein [Clostridia bacterium]